MNLCKHSLTLFNIVNVLMALLVVVTGQYRNALFMSVVLTNLVIGIARDSCVYIRLSLI